MGLYKFLELLGGNVYVKIYDLCVEDKRLSELLVYDGVLGDYPGSFRDAVSDFWNGDDGITYFVVDVGSMP